MFILSYLFEKLTGRRYFTVVSATEQLGPTPGAVIFEAFGDLPDYTLFHNDMELLRSARRVLAERQRKAEQEAREFRRAVDQALVDEVMALRGSR